MIDPETTPLDRHYQDELQKRIPITSGNIIDFCQKCGGPIRMGEPVRGATTGNMQHFFHTTCIQEADFEKLFLKVVGITLE